MKILALIFLLCASGWSANDDIVETLPIKKPLDAENRERFTWFFECIDVKYHQGFVDAISWIQPPEERIDPFSYYKLLLMAAYHQTPAAAQSAFLGASKALTRSTGDLATDMENALGLRVTESRVTPEKKVRSDSALLLPWSVSPRDLQDIPWTVSVVLGSNSESSWFQSQ